MPGRGSDTRLVGARSRHNAVVTETSDQSVETVPRRPRVIAQRQAAVLGGELRDETCVASSVASISSRSSDFSITLVFRDRHLHCAFPTDR
jgi:hypothetical protein